MQAPQRNYSSRNQLNIENYAPQFNTYQNLDTQRLSYTVLESSRGDVETVLQQLAGAIDVKLGDSREMIPFISPKGFEEWKGSTKLFLHGINGVGKSRCIFEIVKSILGELDRIYVINPNNILMTTKVDEPIKTIADLINEVNSNDIIIWYNFPDGLEDGQNPQRGREALVKITSSFVRAKRFFLTLNPAYRELYRGIASRIPEIQDNEVVYTQEQIKKMLRSYGEGVAKYKNVYQNYLENSIELISQILFEREPTPTTVSAYFDAALKQSSSGFLNPNILARQFLLPREFYSRLFKFIREERYQEADFLYTVKLCYDLRLPRTRHNVKTIQEKIFDSPVPQTPEISLSSWVYITSGQYSMSDQARNEIAYPEDKKADIVKYLCSDDFLNFIPKDASVYGSVGTFVGIYLNYLDVGSFSSMLPQDIINIMNRELNFKAGLIYGITLGFSTMDASLQEKIWHLSEGDKGVGVTLFSGLGKLFHNLSPEIQDRLLEKAEESFEIEGWLAYGLGFSFSNLPAETQDNLWKKAKEKPGFAIRLANGISINYPALNRENQEKLWQMASISMDFSLNLGVAIGVSFAFFDEPTQTELMDKIEGDNEVLESGWSMGRAISIQSLDPDSQDQIFEELKADVRTSPFVAIGLGIALMNSNQAVQDKIWSEVEEDDEIKEMFVGAVGGSLSFFKPSLQAKIWEKAEEDEEFASSLAAGLGNVFQALNPSLQNKVWEKAEEDEEFGALLAIGLGRLFPFHTQDFQQRIWKRAEENEDFAYGLATGLGEWSFQSLNQEYENKVWKRAEEDTEFGASLMGLMGPNLPLHSSETREKILQKLENSELIFPLARSFGEAFGYMDEINRESMLEKGMEDSRMSLIVAVGIGGCFLTYDNDLQRRLIERIQIDENQDFFQNFANGLSIYFDDTSDTSGPDARQKLFSLTSKEPKFSGMLGFGVGCNYSYISPDSRNEILSFARQNDQFAFNMGKGTREVFESLEKNTKDELMQMAREQPAFADGLGQNQQD